MAKQVLALIDSWDGLKFIPAGFSDTISDDIEVSDNFKELSGKAEPVDVIQISAIAPTGPNPTAPQQLAPDMIQTVHGYAKAGAIVVGEVTKTAEQRIEIVGLDDNQGTEEDAAEALQEARDERGKAAGSKTDTQNDDDDLVAGTIGDVTSKFAGATDAELDAFEAAENDRERPRTGVLSAIDKEREARQS